MRPVDQNAIGFSGASSVSKAASASMKKRDDKEKEFDEIQDDKKPEEENSLDIDESGRSMVKKVGKNVEDNNDEDEGPVEKGK